MSGEVRATLLLVDDDDAWRTRLARALEVRGFEVRAAASTEEALSSLKEAPEFAVVDLRMPGASGLELLKALLQRDEHTRVLMLTGYGSIPTAIEATRLGAHGYLTKPVDADDVVKALGDTPLSQVEIETPSLARTEWEHIQRVMDDCAGNVSEAARRLRIHRRSLQRKLQKYPPKQ